MLSGLGYCALYCAVFFVLILWHPFFRVKGQENIPKDGGRLVICANHSGMADPFWVCLALRMGHLPRIMAKKEAMSYPVVGWGLKKIGVFGVDRDGADVQAIKTGLRVLRDEQQLLIFPEGTRVRDRKNSHPKRGAVMLAARTQTPILPVYVTMRRYPWQPVTVVIGAPYQLRFDGKLTDQALEEATQSLMEKIYAMEEQV